MRAEFGGGGWGACDDSVWLRMELERAIAEEGADLSV